MLLSTQVKVVSFALLLALATPVFADDERTQIAVLEFDGPGATNVRGEVVRIAAAHAWVSSVSKLAGRSVQALASELDVAMVVRGRIEKQGHNYRIQIQFVRAATGQAIARTVSMEREPKLDSKARRRLERDLARALVTVAPRRDDDSPTAQAVARESP